MLKAIKKSKILLKKQMKQAVDEEDFETAAKIRDEIKKLTNNTQK